MTAKVAQAKREKEKGISHATNWTPAPNTECDPFTKKVDELLHQTTELARQLVPSHQAAAALLVRSEWKDMRKYFSLSSKYANWYEYRTPAKGIGIHAMVVDENKAIRLTQAQLEKHPNFKNFGFEAEKHPPMRGWLAVPIVGHDGANYGLLQLSDKYDDADFTEEDETKLKQLAKVTAIALGSLCHQYHKHEEMPEGLVPR
jgi:GAF domain-containing protein